MGITPASVGVLALGIIPLVLWPESVTFVAVLVVWCVLVAVDVLLAAAPKALTPTEGAVPAIRLGESGSVTLTLTNRGSRPARVHIRYAWQPSAGLRENRRRLVIPASERRTSTFTLHPTRRGLRRAVHITVRSLGPLRLAFRQRETPAHSTANVLHPFESRRHLPSRIARLRELDGQTTIQVRGNGTEFDALKDYVRGDDIRSVDWRATARRQNLAVKTWRPERDRNIVIVVDTSRVAAVRIGDHTKLEYALDAALLLGSLAAKAGDRVHVIAADRTVRSVVQSTSPAGTAQRLIETLSSLEPALCETSWDAIMRSISRIVSHRSLIVLLTAVDDASLETDLVDVVSVLRRRHQVLLATMRDPEMAALSRDRRDLKSVYRAVSAEQALVEHAGTARIIDAAGADLLSVEADRFAPAVADAYLALKAAGRL
ncbi:DUF58 domain-containing protein [Micrococcales bacterium 31B]|nr:DUF58 domain-containing protein [Micrococcales bacterium 31B]